MDFFQSIIKRVFKDSKNEFLGKNAAAEQLKITDEIKAQLAENEHNIKALLNDIYLAYQIRKGGSMGRIHISLHKSSGAEGFFFSRANSGLTTQQFELIFHFLQQKLITNFNYKCSVSDRTFHDLPTGLKVEEKHYCKPRIQIDSVPYNQQFGNVLIEHVKIKGESSYIKVLATQYTDSNYLPAIAFDELVLELFSL